MKILIHTGFCMLLLLLPAAASAQQKPPVTFHGSNVMTGHYAGMLGYPKRF
jgi:hypothetical protein